MRAVLACAAALSLTACASGPRRPPAERDPTMNPLIGRFWDVRTRRMVDQDAVAAALAGADFVFIGETHDNPEHHRLQAALLRSIIAAGRRPAVAFEMLDVSQQPAVDEARAHAPQDPDALAKAVRWDRSGWPDFALYRPIFAAALAAELPIVATNLSRQRARDVVGRGLSVLEAPVREMLARQGPLPEDAERALREEMQESHCGQLPESMLDPMVRMQRARDAEIAYHVLGAARDRGAVLIAGSGHVRDDRGVPAYIAREAPGRKSVAVAFLEVARGEQAPSDYAENFGVERLPFDFVGFTARQEREDPCIGIEKKIRPVPREPEDGTWVRRIDAAGGR